MDYHLEKGKKEVDALGQGFAKGLAKDMGSGMAGGIGSMFKGKKKKQAAAEAAKAAEDKHEAERQDREKQRLEARAQKATGADHMSAASSKLGGAQVGGVAGACAHICGD